MFVDTVGCVPVAGVCCTLCGSMIMYETPHNGVNHQMGTSGFLYRSNKLMYDQATQSLWNTLWVKQGIGLPADEDITLKRRSVETSTWGEWRRRHPDTKVLSLDTGHDRDCSEGAAYRSHFATEELIFHVPELDRRLKNKAEVLVLVAGDESEQLAISAKFLSKNPVHHDAVGGDKFVVLTDASRANLAYATDGVEFTSWDAASTATDKAGRQLAEREDKLASVTGKTLDRFPTHRDFWFAWYASYPKTRLFRSSGLTMRRGQNP